MEMLKVERLDSIRGYRWRYQRLRNHHAKDGLYALLTLWKHPELFGNILSYVDLIHTK